MHHSHHSGDPCQLGPVVHSVAAQALGFAKSLIEHLSGEKSNRNNVVKLKRNYRYDLQSYMLSMMRLKRLANKSMERCFDLFLMVQFRSRSNTNLLELPSRLFYGASLISNAREDELQPPVWKELGNDDGGQSIAKHQK